MGANLEFWKLLKLASFWNEVTSFNVQIIWADLGAF